MAKSDALCVALTLALTKLPDLGQQLEVKLEAAELCNQPGHGEAALNQNNVLCIKLSMNHDAFDSFMSVGNMSSMFNVNNKYGMCGSVYNPAGRTENQSSDFSQLGTIQF